MNRKFPWLLSILIFVATLLVIFASKIFTGHLLAAEDGRVQNYPGFASSGFLWTPLILTGFPVMADPQICFFYPLCYLAKHVGGWNFYVLSGYFLSALFASLFAFRLSSSTFGALICGIAYAFGGYQISELRHVQIVQTAAWLPLLLLFVDHLRLRSKWNLLQFAALAVASALTVLAGHAQTAAYIFATTFLYSLVMGAQQSLKSAILLFSACGAAIALGLALVAVQLIPTYELVQQSVRPTFTYSDFIVGQLEPLQILGFLMPYLLGGKFGSLEGIPFSEQGPPPGLLFYGLAPVCLIVIALVRCWHNQVVRFFAVLSLVAILFALGGHTPLGQVFYHLPVLGSFRGLYRVLLLPAFATCVLSSLAISNIEKRFDDADATLKTRSIKSELLSYWKKAGNWKHLALCLYIFLSCLLPTFLLGTLPLVLFIAKPKQLWRRALLAASILFVLSSYATNSQWYSQSELISGFQAPEQTASLREKLNNSQRIFTLRGLEGLNNEYPPNLSRLWKVANASGYEPLMPLRYMQLLRISEGGFLQPPWRITGGNRAFDICSVRYLYAPKDKFGGRAFIDDAWKYWRLTSQVNDVLVYENTRCRPRWYMVQEAIASTPPEILKAITTGQLNDVQKFDPDYMVLIEDNIKTKSSARAARASTDTISSISCDQESDERIALSVVTDKPGFLVLADQYYPGWQATVDGARVKILRANYIQRAVAIEAGSHKIVFSYQPESFASGRLISLIALALLATIVLAGLFSQKKNFRTN